MRFRLWHLMLLVLVSALAVTGYRLWPRPKPKLTVVRSVHFDLDVTAPAPGLIQTGGTVNLLDQERNGTYWCKVIVLKDADLVWEHSFDDPKHQQQTLKGQLATFKLAPIQIEVAPGHYKVMVQLFENLAQSKKMDCGGGTFVTVD